MTRALLQKGSIRRMRRAALLLLLVVGGVAGSSGLGKVARASGPKRENLAASTPTHFAIGDFDGDNRPDVATVQTGFSESQYLISFRLSTGTRPSIGVTAPAGGLQLTSRDVNGDNILDLIVVTTWLHEPVAILLNDGHGNFSLTDAHKFPAAAWAFERFWNASILEIKDAAFFASRGVPGSIGEIGRISRDASLPEMLGHVALESGVRDAIGLVLGRAPPSFHHV